MIAPGLVSGAWSANADIDDGDPSHLVSADSGAAKVLWKESGTGERWAVVQCGIGHHKMGFMCTGLRHVLSKPVWMPIIV